MVVVIPHPCARVRKRSRRKENVGSAVTLPRRFSRRDYSAHMQTVSGRGVRQENIELTYASTKKI